MKLYEQFIIEMDKEDWTYIKNTSKAIASALVPVYGKIYMMREKCIQSCSASKGKSTMKEYRKCVTECRRTSGKKTILFLKKQISKCNQAKDPKYCKAKIQSFIDKEIKKMK